MRAFLELSTARTETLTFTKRLFRAVFSAVYSSATNAEGRDAVLPVVGQASTTRTAAPTASSPTKATALTPDLPRVSSPTTVGFSQVVMIELAGPSARARLDQFVRATPPSKR